jgi:cytochrome c oxidase subunit II
MKIPNSKTQIPNKSQTSNSNETRRSITRHLEFGAWSLFGIWSLGFGIFLPGCSGNQSALHPAGDQAHRISQLWWVFFYVTAAVYVLVLTFMLVGALRRRQGNTMTDAPVGVLEPGRERRLKTFVGSAVGITVVILFALMISDFFTGRAMHVLDDPNPLTVEVTGHRWWWEVRYKDPVPSNMLVTANEIHVPVGKAVKFELKSTDVIHSFWAPNFHGKKDAIPGHPTTLFFRATQSGEYRGQCAEYCGFQHAHMRFVIVAEAQEQFDKWRQQASQPAAEPSSDAQKRGQQVFLSGTCAMCHTVGGTTANATVGPNLTHIASRKLIGAASFENTPEFLRQWIADPQHFKPGIIMPQHTLRAEDLDSLVAYLAGLK